MTTELRYCCLCQKFLDISEMRVVFEGTRGTTTVVNDRDGTAHQLMTKRASQTKQRKLELTARAGEK